MLIIKLYTFIILPACENDLEMEVIAEVSTCVCPVGTYPSTNDPLVCMDCPAGSTTLTTNSPDINACGKNARIIIDWY